MIYAEHPRFVFNGACAEFDPYASGSVYQVKGTENQRDVELN